MKTPFITRSKGGTAERQVKLATLQIPDLWHVSTFTPLEREMVLDCWHLAEDLKRELLELHQKHAALKRKVLKGS